MSITTIPKGAYAGECNRTACNNRPANHWNKSTQRFYCVHCARRINAEAGEELCLGLSRSPGGEQ